MFNELEIREYRLLANCLTYVGDRKVAFAAAKQAAKLLRELDLIADNQDQQQYGIKAARRRSAKCVARDERRASRK